MMVGHKKSKRNLSSSYFVGSSSLSPTSGELQRGSPPHHSNSQHSTDPNVDNNTAYVTVCDGPYGVRKPLIETSLQDSYLATCFPTLSCLSCSWDRHIMKKVGNALRHECKLRRVQVLLGPGINIKRHPCNGRNFEYFTEDPYLNGVLASYYIAGLQQPSSSSNGNEDDDDQYKVGACVKHYAVNNQETNRWVIDVIIDERTMREIYLRGFEIVVRGTANLNKTTKEDDDHNDEEFIDPSHDIANHQRSIDDNIVTYCCQMNHEPPASMMCAYNKVNGVYCSEHYELITQILRHEWHYDGIMMSDWGACNDRSLSIRAGLDLEMPGSCGAYNPYLLSLLQNYAASSSQQQQQEQSHHNQSSSNHHLYNSNDATANTTTTTGQHDGAASSSIITIDSQSNASYLYEKVNECVTRMVKFIYMYQPPPPISSDESYLYNDGNKTNHSSVHSSDHNDHDHSHTQTNHDYEPSSNEHIHNTIHTTLDFDDETEYLATFDPTKLTHCEYNILEANYQIAYEVALECCVLLKNDNHCLPLLLQFNNPTNNSNKRNRTTTTTMATTTTILPKTTTTIGIIGAFGFESPRYQGMGSSQLNPYKVTTVYDAFITRQKQQQQDEEDIYRNPIMKRSYDTTVLYSAGYDPNDDHLENIDDKLLNDAIITANQCDVVIICIGLPEIMEAEGLDRPNIQLPAQHNALVMEICQQRQRMSYPDQKVIVLLSNGSPIELTSWYEYPDAIMECYLLGSAGGDAIVDILCGIVSPCGKLAETFPKSVHHIESNQYFPTTGMSDRRVEYREGLNIGYRQIQCDENDIEHILYPFGHGLSYTTFAYSNIQTRIICDRQDRIVVHVTCDIQNIGQEYTAKEVIQCYIRDVHSSVYRPYHELKDFMKIELTPGEKRTIQFILTKDAFAFYDIGFHDWIVECGTFEIRIGSSSRDIKLIDTIHLHVDHGRASDIAIESYPPKPTLVFTNTTRRQSSSNSIPNGQFFENVDDKTFAKRFGTKSDMILQEIIEYKRIQQEESKRSMKIITSPSSFFTIIHRNTMLKEIANRRILGHLLFRVTCYGSLYQLEQGHMKKDSPALYNRHKRMMMATIESLPLRALVLFSKGALSFAVLDALIHLMNFRYISATISLAKAFVSLFLNEHKT